METPGYDAWKLAYPPQWDKEEDATPAPDPCAQCDDEGEYESQETGEMIACECGKIEPKRSFEHV